MVIVGARHDQSGSSAWLLWELDMVTVGARHDYNGSSA